MEDLALEKSLHHRELKHSLNSLNCTIHHQLYSGQHLLATTWWSQGLTL